MISLCLYCVCVFVCQAGTRYLTRSLITDDDDDDDDWRWPFKGTKNQTKAATIMCGTEQGTDLSIIFSVRVSELVSEYGYRAIHNTNNTWLTCHINDDLVLSVWTRSQPIQYDHRRSLSKTAELDQSEKTNVLVGSCQCWLFFSASSLFRAEKSHDGAIQFWTSTAPKYVWLFRHRSFKKCLQQFFGNNYSIRKIRFAIQNFSFD